MVFSKKKRYQDEIKQLRNEKIENLKKEIETLQEIICNLDADVKKCVKFICINKDEISKIDKKIIEINEKYENNDNRIIGYG